ncbi:unnamed protein product [Blepharisma stoltei]|uniref:Reverse transcriptase domain-containing protein n=1 Tax=Blepharisma stoltei TaxID=1481888 RepID=A0AAU9JMN6_9CILI|nr:unnamed protein product [Blepharisma stoltei]
MRNGPTRFTKSEEGKIVDWWRTQYGDRDWDWTVDTQAKPPTREEVEEAIKALSNRKATGPDGVPSELIKYGGQTVVELHWRIITDVWKRRWLPRAMKGALVVLLPKKLGSKAPDDYRPITLLNTSYKILDKIVANRLALEVEAKSIMHPTQAGFMKGMSTADQIYRLETVIEHCRTHKKGIICGFLDICKAFDTVRHSDLNEVMLSRGVNTDTISIIGAMYNNCESNIIMNDRLSDPIRIKKGVRQGGSSSPICFNLIPNELAWAISSADVGVELKSGEMKLGLLLYADDIVLMAHTMSQLQQLMNICNTWANKYYLKANLQKSFVVDYSGKPARVTVTIEGKQLKQLPQFKYLGKVIGTSRSDSA